MHSNTNIMHASSMHPCTQCEWMHEGGVGVDLLSSMTAWTQWTHCAFFAIFELWTM